MRVCISMRVKCPCASSLPECAAASDGAKDRVCATPRRIRGGNRRSSLRCKWRSKCAERRCTTLRTRRGALQRSFQGHCLTCGEDWVSGHGTARLELFVRTSDTRCGGCWQARPGPLRTQARRQASGWQTCDEALLRPTSPQTWRSITTHAFDCRPMSRCLVAHVAFVSSWCIGYSCRCCE